MICLPESWPVTPESIVDENYYWPIRQLKGAARYPHDNETWIYCGHTIVEKARKPFAPNTRFSAVMLASPKTLPESARRVALGKNREIQLWSLIPLYEEELTHRLDCGYLEFEKLLQENEVTEILSPTRNSVVSSS
jgi:hypothetical protein